MDMSALLIGDVAQLADVSAPTIRYYERLKLLTPPRRTSGGYRRYSDATIETLRFIKKAQGLGFSLDEIGEILKLTRSGQTPCARVLSLGHQHLAAVEQRIRELQGFRELLSVELSKWEQQQPAVSCEKLCQFIADAEVGTGSPDSAAFQRQPKKSATHPRRKVRE